VKKNILVTGATGSVGFEVLKELSRRIDRYHIRLLSLDTVGERKILKPFVNNVEIIWGDICNLDDVNRAVSGADVVLHLAAIIPPLADQQPQLAFDVNVGGTRNILMALRKQPDQPTLIFASSVSVYGDRVNDPYINVGDPLISSVGDEYARTKIQAEEMVRVSGLSWTVFRLCGILTSKLKIQPLMFHMPLETALEWCHGSDAGLALVNAIESDAIGEKIFNLGGGETCRISARNFLNEMLPMFGIQPTLIPAYAFAIQNFHSGYYADSHKLNDLLHFQRKSLREYFSEVRTMISPVQKALIKMIPNKVVRNYFVNMSEPIKAIRENNQELIARFYGSREAFERLLSANY
jgi:nucleoside-diphosphate-sugar epimerase